MAVNCFNFQVAWADQTVSAYYYTGRLIRYL
jgi:hypothetical protein